MNVVLQLGNQAIALENLPALLERYQLLPHLLRELIIDQAIVDIKVEDQEIDSISRKVTQQNNLESQSLDDTMRALKIQKFKKDRWGHQIKHYFLEQKDKLDQVIYSLIRTQNIGIADELYFRLQEGEQSFAELASTYSQGPEALTYGLIGPVELGQYHPTFAQVLATSPLGEITSPIQLDNWLVILRIERRIPAQMNELTQQRLMDELFEKWLQEEIAVIYPYGIQSYF